MAPYGVGIRYVQQQSSGGRWPLHVAMSKATDEATSLWLTKSDKALIREYRNEVFDTEHIGLRHAVRHAINEARGDGE